MQPYVSNHGNFRGHSIRSVFGKAVAKSSQSRRKVDARSSQSRRRNVLASRGKVFANRCNVFAKPSQSLPKVVASRHKIFAGLSQS